MTGESEPAGRPQSFPSFSAAEVDEVIATWGVAQRDAMHSESRASLASELFDVRRRSWVGFECYYEAAPPLLRMLVSRGATPELLGEMMKVPGSRPYYLQLFLLMSNYLAAREERVLRHGVPPDATDDQAYDDLRTIVEFFTRTARSYRNDGAILPPAPHFDQRILDDAWVERCAAELGPTSELDAITKMSAMLSLYNFLLHGEQRDGQFDHGPYPGPRGSQIIIREFNDLANDFLPWRERESPMPHDNVCVAYAYRNVATRFTIFATAVTDPTDFAPHVEAVAAFVREGDRLDRLDRGRMESIAAHAKELQLRLYKRVLQWEQLERSRYGLYLYANSLLPYFILGGCSDLRPILTTRFEAIGDRVARELAQTETLPGVLAYFGEIRDGPLFAPTQRA